MKYIKTFENFDGSLTNIDPKLQDVVNKKVGEMSDIEREKVLVDLNKLADILGLSMEDMRDPKLVDSALKNAGCVSESVMNEGLKDWWRRQKLGFHTFLYAHGIGTALTGVVSGVMSVVQGTDVLGGHPSDPLLLSSACALILGGVVSSFAYAFHKLNNQ